MNQIDQIVQDLKALKRKKIEREEEEFRQEYEKNGPVIPYDILWSRNNHVQWHDDLPIRLDTGWAWDKEYYPGDVPRWHG